jgi:Galactose-1-phosphate uridyltransferase
MNINYLISELIEYGVNSGLIPEEDRIYYSNKLLEFFGVEEYTAEEISSIRPINEILEDCIAYAEEAGLLVNPTTTEKDLYDTKIMGLITPPPSIVRDSFHKKYVENPEAATKFYYSFSKATNYIRTDRIKKDEKWVSDTPFGALDITINLSKPEKDPRDIAAAGKAKKSGYPACLLCKENEGYAGHISHPARQNHRIIPIELCGEKYNLQYSPYVYYNEHCIIFNDEHIPMKIDRSTFAKLLDFVRQFPHYTAGSNADLPIVGGSILSHDHFQGGCYEFPMVRAPYESEFIVSGFEDVHSGVIKWPLTTIRLQSENIERIVGAADLILNKWRSYTDKDAFIFSETDGIPHNTITPIARMRGNLYELDLVLRNNITTDEHPLGVYHPHSEYHHIKKENIGLIEVMGLAVLPARLKKEMSELKDAILSGHLTKESISTVSSLAPHAEWAEEFSNKYGITEAELHELCKAAPEESDNRTDKLTQIIRDEIGLVFSHVLEDAGVYKCTPEGRTALYRFLNNL